jgi:hypothetical protein
MGLVDDAGQGLREARVAHPVQDHGSDGDLPLVGLALGFGGDHTG